MIAFQYKKSIPLIICILAILFPFVFSALGQQTFIYEITTLLPYCILAMALNVVVGYTGMLHLGIMAFFAIGAYVTGIAVHQHIYPFHFTFFSAMLFAVTITAFAGLVIGAPTLRLRGDYLAIVTLGFGEMVKDVLAYSPEITQGAQGITPILLRDTAPEWLLKVGQILGDPANNRDNTKLMYYLCLIFVIAVYWLLGNIERSRLGRAWNAVREDELAATCMGMSAIRVRMSAFVVCAGLAGLGGCLFDFVTTSTTEPNSTFNFNYSVIVLACVIMGGMGNRLGVLIGVFLVLGADKILIPYVDSYVDLKSWKLMIYGLGLVLMMRFRPEGILPEMRIAHEMHGFKNAESLDDVPLQPSA